MKSKPFGALFGLLALVAILGVAPAFGEVEVDISKGAGAGPSAGCVAANNCFNPNTITVTPGTTVTWKNLDTMPHTVTSGLFSDNQTGTIFDSGAITKNGGEFKYTFNDLGKYPYFCSYHTGWMAGQVIVAASTTPSTNTTTTTPDNTTAVPEFGPVASIVLAIAVMSMVVFVAKTRGIPKF